MAGLNGRIAVVVVHGMGNQFPMDTLREFAGALQPDGAKAYSSPNRITDEKETRRLSFSTGPYDFFEYYWAHYVEEPGISEILKWAFRLIFTKKPSARLKNLIWIVRAVVVLLAAAVGILAYYWYHSLKADMTAILSVTLWGAGAILFFKFAWNIISSTVLGKINTSVGDVIKYTVPSPKNIATREQIRKSGIELLKNLHEAKTENGQFKYTKIVLAAHSLGTVVAYDILTSLFAQYHRKFSTLPDDTPETAPGQGERYPSAVQLKLEELKTTYSNPDHTGGKYQLLQAALFDEYKKLTNEWRVSNFITMGSPLTHASMILAPGADEFNRKKDQREFPVSPPQFDTEDDHFTFPSVYKKVNGNKIKVKNLHHAAHFAETQWTNIYFENDWIGGKLANEFGAGIVDISVVPANKLLAAIPLATHTRYWDTKHDVSLKTLKDIFDTIHKL